MAALCNMKLDDAVQKKLVEKICKGLRSDDLWDESDEFEKAYKECGLKRYRLDKKMLGTESTKDAHVEDFSSQTGGQGKKNALDAASSSSSSGATMSIKIQNPEYHNMLQTVKVTKSAAAAVGSLSSTLKTMVPGMQLVGEVVGSLQHKATYLYMYIYIYISVGEHVFP